MQFFMRGALPPALVSPPPFDPLVLPVRGAFPHLAARSSPAPPLFKPRPCPSYSRRRGRINVGPNLNLVPNVVRPHKTWVW